MARSEPNEKSAITINSVLSSWGIAKDHPFFRQLQQQIFDQLLMDQLEYHKSRQADVLDILTDDPDNIAVGMADLAWLTIDALCEEVDCNSDADYVIDAASKTLSTLAEIGNKSEKMQIHERTLGEAWEITNQQLADRYGINVQQTLNRGA